MKVLEHEHPLKLIDLRLEYANLEEQSDEEDGDSITGEEYRCACDRCNQEINMHHRHYYKCMGGSLCDFSLHKYCAEIPTRLVHTSHPHPLNLGNDQCQKTTNWICSICESHHKLVEIHYKCSSCDFFIDVKCAVEVGKKIIYHPCHPQMCAIYKPILCHCNACDNEHKGLFYQCTTCGSFTIHNDCAFLPKKLLIQQVIRKSDVYHPHPFTISYSFPKIDHIAKHYPRCRVCGGSFSEKEYVWTCKCDKCLYYAYVDCASGKSFSYWGAVRAEFRKTSQNFIDVDYPHLLHLPFPDETYNIPKHLFFQENGTSRMFRIDEVNLIHISNQHPLILIDQTQSNDIIDQTLSKINLLLMCHNPMKKSQLLCNGCLRPITNMPFFKCTNEDENCNFVLHEWCTRLPTEIENHPYHSQHTLSLVSNVLELFFGVFHCAVCGLPCNGFAYCCVECEYYVGVTCGFIPKHIMHKAHPNHL